MAAAKVAVAAAAGRRPVAVEGTTRAHSASPFPPQPTATPTAPPTTAADTSADGGSRTVTAAPPRPVAVAATSLPTRRSAVAPAWRTTAGAVTLPNPTPPPSRYQDHPQPRHPSPPPPQAPAPTREPGATVATPSPAGEVAATETVVVGVGQGTVDAPPRDTTPSATATATIHPIARCRQHRGHRRRTADHSRRPAAQTDRRRHRPADAAVRSRVQHCAPPTTTTRS